MGMARAKRAYELAYASAFLAADGPVEIRKQKATLTVGQGQELAEALGRWEGLKAAVRALETRASVAQSVLRAHTREYQSSTQASPAWSGR
jgi:hypothetical protein